MSVILGLAGPFGLNGEKAADQTIEISRCVQHPSQTGLETRKFVSLSRHLNCLSTLAQLQGGAILVSCGSQQQLFPPSGCYLAWLLSASHRDVKTWRAAWALSMMDFSIKSWRQRQLHPLCRLLGLGPSRCVGLLLALRRTRKETGIGVGGGRRVLHCGSRAGKAYEGVRA